MLIKIKNTFRAFRQGCLYDVNDGVGKMLIDGGFAEKIPVPEPEQSKEPEKQSVKTRGKKAETAALSGGETAAEIL